MADPTSQSVLSNKQPRCHGWSDLPTDVLESVSFSLPFSDVFSLKDVCSSWRAATKGINRPLLVFFSKCMSNNNNNEGPEKDSKVSLIGINKETPLCLKQPGIYCYDDNVVGLHPDGWVFLTDENGHYFIMELSTLVRIELPKNLKSETSRDWSHKAILSDNPNCRPDFIIILLYGNNKVEQKLAFWRNGDSEWSSLGGNETRRYSDIVWSNDVLYAVKNGRLAVEVWDLKRNGINSGSSTKKLTIINDPMIVYSSTDEQMNKFVVSSTGEILIVVYRKKWEVFRIDLSEERCIELNTLNGQALIMVGIDSEPRFPFGNHMAGHKSNNLFCISSTDVGKYGYKPNSIYFAKVESWNYDTYVRETKIWSSLLNDRNVEEDANDRKIQLWNYSFEHGEAEKVWESMISLDVKLQPLGLFLLNNNICGRWSGSKKVHELLDRGV